MTTSIPESTPAARPPEPLEPEQTSPRSGLAPRGRGLAESKPDMKFSGKKHTQTHADAVQQALPNHTDVSGAAATTEDSRGHRAGWCRWGGAGGLPTPFSFQITTRFKEPQRAWSGYKGMWADIPRQAGGKAGALCRAVQHGLCPRAI